MDLQRTLDNTLDSHALSGGTLEAFVVVYVLYGPYVCFKFWTNIFGDLRSVILVECSYCEVSLCPTFYFRDY